MLQGGANETQRLLIDTFGIEHFVPAKNLEIIDDDDVVSLRWSGNSPDMSPVENLGSIMMDKVSQKVERMRGKRTRVKLIRATRDAIRELGEDQTLLNSLIKAMSMCY